MRNRVLSLWLVVVATAATVAWGSTASGAPMFIGLGDLGADIGDPLAGTSAAAGVSGNGDVVVGYARNADAKNEAFRWTLSGGMVGLGEQPGASYSSYWGFAYGASGDGTEIAGYAYPGVNQQISFRWTSTDGLTALAVPSGTVGSVSFGISNDGMTIVGESYMSGVQQPTKWVDGTPLLLGVNIDQGTAHAVSGDGSIVVGDSWKSGSPIPGQVTRWVGSDEIRMGVEGTAYGISADGSTIVGTALLGSYFEAFSWSNDTFTRLGGLDANAVNPWSRATDASADGSIIVGITNVRMGGSEDNAAFIWDATNGMRLLKDVLVDDWGLDLTGWGTLAQGNLSISDDGLVIAGTGTPPGGGQQGWVAIIPEPGTGLLVMTGLLGIAYRERRHGRAA